MLDENSTGRWAVHTADTVHLLDLDAATYERRPAPNTAPDEGLDGYVLCDLLLEVVEQPRLGGRLRIRYALRADPWRRSRTFESDPITAIAPAPPAVDELAHTLPGSPPIRIPPGWCPLVRQLHAELIELEPRYTVTTVKDKHDGLRFYIAIPDHTPGHIAEAMCTRIDWAQEESRNRCILCGAPTPLAGHLCERHPPHSA